MNGTFCDPVILASSTSASVVSIARGLVDYSVIVTAFELKDFERSGHSYASLIPESTQKIIDCLIKDTLRPPRLSRLGRPSFSSAAFEDLWPQSWAVDKASLRQAVKAFAKSTEQVRRLLEDPSSTGNTPSSSPKSSLPLGQQQPSPDATTRASSAEEAIYDRPIGPELPPDMASGSNNGQPGQPGQAATGGFTPDQLNSLSALFQTLINANNATPQLPPPETMTPRTPQFRARDIGYFDPNPQSMPVEVKDNHNIYHNVFSFTSRLRVKATTMDPSVLRLNLDSCLLGSADDWFTNQLTHASRQGLRHDPDGVKGWCDTLEERFRDSPSKSLSMLEAIRYTTKDARNRRDPADYVSTIVLNSKNAGIAPTEAA